MLDAESMRAEVASMRATCRRWRRRTLRHRTPVGGAVTSRGGGSAGFGEFRTRTLLRIIPSQNTWRRAMQATSRSPQSHYSLQYAPTNCVRSNLNKFACQIEARYICNCNIYLYWHCRNQADRGTFLLV